jgi:hypothetical protein
MKYIKRFNESLASEFSEENIRNICEEHLVELYDIGFKTNITLWRKGDNIIIDLYNGEQFKWDDIKEIYIPFILFLDEKFEIESFKEDNYPMEWVGELGENYVLGGEINHKVLRSLKVGIIEKK